MSLPATALVAAGPSNPPPRRKRISNAGRAVLEEYLKRTQNYYPSKKDQEGLLQKILALPDNEHFILYNVTCWFARRRDKPRRESEQENNSLYPSLTKDSINHLATLAQAAPSPIPFDVIATWAKLLHADVKHVNAWLSEQQQLRSRSSVPHLPTPVSTSPEPRSSSWDSNSFKTDPTNSPVLPPPQPTHFLSLAPTQIQPPPALTPVDLLKAITKASNSVQAPMNYPTTSQEFEQMFDPYLTRIGTILQKLDPTPSEMPLP